MHKLIIDSSLLEKRLKSERFIAEIKAIFPQLYVSSRSYNDEPIFNLVRYSWWFGKCMFWATFCDIINKEAIFRYDGKLVTYDQMQKITSVYMEIFDMDVRVQQV